MEINLSATNSLGKLHALLFWKASKEGIDKVSHSKMSMTYFNLVSRCGFRV